MTFGALSDRPLAPSTVRRLPNGFLDEPLTKCSPRTKGPVTPADTKLMTGNLLKRFRGWSLAVAALIACAALAPSGASAAVTLSNWDAAQQRAVVHAGLMGNVGRSFQGASPITASQADAAMAALAVRLQGTPGAVSTNAVNTARDPVTVVNFDQMLVAQLGLSATASHVQSVAAAAGLHPPAYFGSEVVTRFLGLRYNHPASTDQLELFPSDSITRAEAAWSLAQVIGFGDWNASYAQQTLAGFRAPDPVGRAASGAADRDLKDRLPIRVGRDN